MSSHIKSFIAPGGVASFAYLADGDVTAVTVDGNAASFVDSGGVLTIDPAPPAGDAIVVTFTPVLATGLGVDLASANVWTATQTVPRLVAATGTITASEPVLDLSQTWNAGGITFTGIKLNITDTASAAASLLADFQIGGVSKFQVTKDGKIGAAKGYVPGTPQFYDSTLGSGHGFQIINEYATSVCLAGAVQYQFDLSDQTGFRFNAAWPISWMAGGAGSGTCYAQLRSDGAEVIAQRNASSYTSAQTFRVYGTYTDSSNYVRAALSSSSTAVTLAAETAGTGADNVPVNITPAGTEGVQIGNFAQLTEMTAPAAGAANTARIFAEDNGAGKTRIMAQFASGAAVQIAIEP